ncbi:MAG: twin-arginine translocase TatA/TatE family subunit [Salinivirgaceae bacterium]|nr:twin-arginine translocase TatA/TatE family subunit [Salinivirgaceae bacterium]
MKTMLLMNLGVTEIVLIALVVLLLFGGKKIPELMRGLGKGVRSFKDGLNDKADGEPKNQTDGAENGK